MYTRVLVPVDGSDVAAAVIPFIVGIAGPLDFKVTLLRVIHPVPPLGVDGPAYFNEEDVAARHAEAAAYLAGLAGTLEARGLRVRTLVRRGEPAREILAAATEARADLIAMATHGRTGATRVLLGSVAEDVLRHADVPVFLLRQTEKELARRQRELEAR